MISGSVPPASGPAAPPGADVEHTWRSLLGRLAGRGDLGESASTWAMDEIMSGSASDAQIAAFAVLLRAKGETVAELTGLAGSMLRRAPAVATTGRSVDIVGTGGDGAHTVNISTMAAIVAAASGRPVVKHGNRAASSACGAADVLEALGIAIDLPAAAVARTVREIGIGFCFAAVFHPGMRHAGSARRDLGIPTAFNFLGPLTNPARPAASAIGCADRAMAPLMAQVLAARGDTALVFRGDDGLDELTTASTSSVWIVTGGTVSETMLDPSALGIAAASPDALRGGAAPFNAAVVREVLAGGSPQVRAAVTLNAGAAIAAFDGLGAPETLDAALRDGIRAAEHAIDSGSEATLLSEWAALSQSLRAT
ncbi:MAG: anthranilate phosphoribosyltransferase [Pseudonocardiales bacterium]|nr:anthranilate phosphoribosyltransferase [Pseudonocardiales bacterium]